MTTPADVQDHVSAALRPVAGLVVPADVAQLLARWLADYAQFRRQPGQSGVPMLLLEIQRAFAEFAAGSSRQREDLRPMSLEVLPSTYAEVDTSEAAAALGCSADNVRWHIARGNLMSRKVGRQHMISVGSLEGLRVRLAERREA